MNHKVGRRYLPVVMMASSLAIASACSSTAPATGALSPTAGASSPGTPSVTPTAPAVAGAAPIVPVAPAAEAGALTISNGTADVTVGSATVHLSSNATEVSWSADGSQMVYVDGDGNIAVASWDGSGVRVLTKTDKSVLRAQPVWISDQIAFSERDKKGVWHLQSVWPATRRLGEPEPTYVEASAAMNVSDHDHAPSRAYIAGLGARGGVELVAYEHDAAAGAQIWIIDYNQREADGSFLIAGAHPALSPDGKSLAYVGKNGQIYVTPVAKASKASSKQITFGLTGIVHPVWTPDGDRITFATATEVESVTAKLAPGVTTNKPTVLSAKPGVPAYVPLATTAVHRLTGADPVADSIAISKQRWNPTNLKINRSAENGLPMAMVVTLVSSADPTVLMHIPALGSAIGPVLFTDGKTLDPRTAAEIKRALGKAADPGMGLRIQIYGDTSVMSPAIQTAAAALGYPVSRTAGTVKPLENSPVVVVSDTDQATLGNLLYLYQNFEVVQIHGTTMTPAQQALFRKPSNGPLMVYVAGAAAHTAVAADWSTKPTADNMRIVDLPASTADESILFQPYYARVVNLVAEGDWKSMVLANQALGLVIVVPKGGSLSAAAVTWLRTNAAQIDTINAFGDASNVSAATLAAATAAVSGPAGSKS